LPDSINDPFTPLLNTEADGIHGGLPVETFGRVVAVRGLLVEVAGPVAAMRLGGRLDVVAGHGSILLIRSGFPIPAAAIAGFHQRSIYPSP
jgi:hypothetical protein